MGLDGTVLRLIPACYHRVQHPLLPCLPCIDSLAILLCVSLVLTPQSLSPIPGWRCGYKTPMLLPRWPGDNTPVQMKTGVMVGGWPKVSGLSVWPLKTAEILLCIFPRWYNNLLERHIVQRTRDGALKLSVQCNALKVTIVSSFSFQFFLSWPRLGRRTLVTYS
jgi:hypothetical protein